MQTVVSLPSSAPTVAPQGAPPAGRRPRLLPLLCAVLVAIWHQAPTTALQWRAACAVELVAPLVPEGHLTALPQGSLRELRQSLAELITCLSWDARERLWWPPVQTALVALLADLTAELSKAVA